MRGFIFDLDGVVADTTPAHFRSWQRLAEEMGIPFDPGTYAAMLGRTREDSLDVLLRGRALDRAERLECLVRKQAYFTVELAEMTAHDVLPGVLPLIRAARENDIGIALASSSRNAHAVLDRLGIAPLFDVVADGLTVAMPKPAPDIFLWAAARLGRSPGQCVVFEDAPAGIAAARAGGFSVVALRLDDPSATWRRSSLVGAHPDDFVVAEGTPVAAGA